MTEFIGTRLCGAFFIFRKTLSGLEQCISLFPASVDVEGGVGNSHLPGGHGHGLANSTAAAEPEPSESGGGGGSPELESEKSVLQAKLTNLAIQIGYGGMAVSLVTVIILSIKFSINEFYYQVRERVL